MDDVIYIADLLKKTREEKNITIEKASRDTKIQSYIISALEKGKISEMLPLVYSILFLKKYADYLGLDGGELSVAYKKIYTKATEERDEEKAEESRKTLLYPFVYIDKYKKSIAYTFVIISSGIIIIFLISNILNYTRDIQKQKYVQPLNVKMGSKKTKIVSRTRIITLKAMDDVWIRAKKGKEKLFEGILEKNKNISWILNKNDRIALWTGKAEALGFSIDKKYIGVIGKGVLKNIEITPEGFRLNDRWIVDFDTVHEKSHR